MDVAEPQPATPRPKRRWYQYSLRTLFAVTTCIAIVLGWIRNRYVSLPDGFERNCFLRDAITLASCGTAALICLALGVALFCAARSSRLHPALAVVIFVPLSFVAIGVPTPLARTIARLLSQESLYWGDSGFELLIAEFCMFWFVVVTIVVFILAICFFRRRPTTAGRQRRKKSAKRG
jgi:hypothetical protein